MLSGWIVVGSVSAFLSVALGAFGAHGLKEILDEKALSVFHTAAQYQMYHALALFGLGILVTSLKTSQPLVSNSNYISFAGWAFTLGTLLFSGSLYALAITGIKVLGAITPLGGLMFMAGWISLIIVAFKS